MYSVTSKLTKRICAEIGWNPSINAIETMMRGKSIHVRGTALKPSEANQLERFCELNGYSYHGPYSR